MNRYNTLIIGQGMAGTTLAHNLIKKGKSVLIIDRNDEHTASKISSGLINPITGRRFVKSWMFDDLRSSAIIFFNYIHKKYNYQYLKPISINRTILNVRDENYWTSIAKNKAYNIDTIENIEQPLFQHLTNKYTYLTIPQAFQLHVKKYLNDSKVDFLRSESLIFENFDIERLRLTKQVNYKNYIADNIVFCQGWQDKSNPLFEHLPFSLNRAEVIISPQHDYQNKNIIKHRYFIIPHYDQKLWIGSTADRNFEKEKMPISKELLRMKQTMSNLKVEISNHSVLSAIRPTTKNRRPLIGRHYKYPMVYIFNGLGSKGISLAPYWSEKLAELIYDNIPLDIEVDIQKYTPF